MAIEAMTSEEIEDVSGGINFGLIRGLYSGWSLFSTANFSYADMRGNYYLYTYGNYWR